MEVKTDTPLLAPYGSESIGKERVAVLAGETDPNYQGETDLLLHNEGKEQYVWNIGALLGCLLALSCPLTRINGKIQ